jgi:hypothetical protein
MRRLIGLVAIVVAGCMADESEPVPAPTVTVTEQPASLETPAPSDAADPKVEITTTALPGPASKPEAATEPTALDPDACQELTQGEPPIDDCFSGTITCGETIIGHTRGGVDRYNTRFYEKNMCTPATTNHNGGDERVYRLDVPDGRQMTTVTLDTPCADLDVAAFKWNQPECPHDAHLINGCEMAVDDRSSREEVKLFSMKKTTWLIVVEGKADDEGAFALTVDCDRG